MGGARPMQEMDLRNNNLPKFPILKLSGLDPSMDKGYLMQIFDKVGYKTVYALQVVRDDDEPYAFIQFVNPESATIAMNNYRNWMPPGVVLELFRSPDEGHRDKHPKNHHKLLPDFHRSELLSLSVGCSMPSVERITVKDVKHKTCAAKIYGKVMVCDHKFMQIIYRRGPSQSEEKRSGDYLELKGPNRSALDLLFGIDITINLFEERDGQERVFARGFLCTGVL